MYLNIHKYFQFHITNGFLVFSSTILIAKTVIQIQTYTCIPSQNALCVNKYVILGNRFSFIVRQVSEDDRFKRKCC